MECSVLVVDDEEFLRRYVARVVADEGYRVSVAKDGFAALALFDTTIPPIDLVITDVLMPGMDGVELASRLARRTPAPQVLFVTGGHGLPDLPGPVLWKPFLGEDLRDTVHRLLDGREAKTARLSRHSAQSGMTCGSAAQSFE